MRHISVEPPPFFHRGPSPLARLAFFGLLSLALLFADSRYHYLESVRRAVGTLLYPLQRVVQIPGEAIAYVGTYFSSQRTLANDSAALKERLLADAPAVQGYSLLEQENARLRTLLTVEKRFQGAAIAAEVMYSGRDPFTQKLFVDKGDAAGVLAGQAVIDELGVIGQVTRVFPNMSEVTLVTDKDHAVPVRVERSGVRSVMYGSGTGRLPELRFLSPNAEIQPGDRLVTSGIDGTYPAGLAVAQVVSVERETGQMFARVTCRPLAGVDRSTLVLILAQAAVSAPRPEEPTETDAPRKGRGRRRAN
ncbi:MAG TPA: rod shape-determining protein MreC [Casimicrobiaceae bacterium]|nr:rod shape-determining protein MreC [Casimicrobiaceae bacterium]